MKNLALVGFMGSGKSTAGPLLAKEIGWDFVDLDELIEERTGKSINAIFQEEGERAFRRYEAEALADVSRRAGTVVSCGGGVVTTVSNRRLLSKRFHVIYLHLDLATIRNRLRGSVGRPLIQVREPQAKIRELYNERLPLYRDVASYVIEAKALAPSEIVAAVTKWASEQGLNMAVSRVPIRLGDRQYEIVVGSGIADRLIGLLASLGIDTSTVVLVVSRKVQALWEGMLRNVFAKTRVVSVEINDSERSKSLRSAARLYDRLVEARVDRSTPLIAVGGGVIGDLAGFVASTYMRGIPLIHIPTTLLAQVDSSIGGKTAVNHPEAKNIIGTFYQPRLVLSDTRFLATLPSRQLRSGLAEVIKYALLEGSRLLSDVRASMPFLRIADSQRSQPVISDCARVKARIVQEDEKDEGLRAVLNYGHTVGHAVEAAAGYRGWTHGEAISVGMMAGAYVALSLGMLDQSAVETHERLLSAAKLPTALSRDLAEDLVEHLRLDKKAVGGRIMMVLLKGIGKPEVRQVPLPVIKRALRQLEQ